MAGEISLGATLKQGITQAVQVTSITPPQPEVGVVETTDLDSVDRSYKPTIRMIGECTFEINYSPSLPTHATITTSLLAKTIETWTVTLPDTGAATYAFSAFVKKFAPGPLTVDGLITATITLQGTGALTITP